MKANRFLTVILVLLLLCSLCGCGAESDAGNSMTNGSYAGAAAEGAAPEADKGLTNSAQSGQAAVPTDQKLIRTVYLDAETEDMDALLADVEDRIVQLGGYVESRNVYNGTTSRAQSRTASLTIRIPASQLDQFVGQVSDVSNVVSHSENTKDVTLTYVGTESRIKALETEEARLLELLAMAESLEDLLVLEERLTEIRTELERHKSQLKLYDNQVNYGTIYLNVEEVEEYTVVEEPEPEPGFWKRLGDGFVRSVENMWTILKGLVIFFVSAIPYLILPGTVLAIILVPKWVRNRKFNKLAKEMKEREKKEKEKKETDK